MKKTFTWIGANGNVFELEAECTMEVTNEVLNADGYEIETGKKETYINANLVAKIDGKEVDSCWNTDFWRIIDVKNGIKRIWGIDKIGFTAEKAIEIEAFLKDVIESAKTEEVKEIEAEEAAKKHSKDVKNATRIIEEAHKQETIPTAREAREMERRWNDLYNEGGEGYVPHIVDIDEYNWALSILGN